MVNFSPKPAKKELIIINIEPDKMEQVSAMAAKYHLSRNQFINQCVDFAMANMKFTTKNNNG